MYNLVYLAKPIYGGWVSFTAHMALKYELPVLKIGKRTEPNKRQFGYGVEYQNVGFDDIKKYDKMLITAIDKHFYDKLDLFPNGTYVVIHDPSEVTKKTSDILLTHLKRFKIVTIRKSVEEYLLKEFGLKSKFIVHPFYEYEFNRDKNPSKAVSVARIDYDKHTDIILEANKILKNVDESKIVKLYGAANFQYAFFKLDALGFKKYYQGAFDKTFEALNNILKDAKYMIDMSVIKHDGGGTQYTFLEAIYQGCALVINKKWVSGFKTPFEHNVNCYVVENGEELAELLVKDKPIKKITETAKLILKKHVNVNWIKELNSM
jgi:hypothetical protein